MDPVRVSGNGGDQAPTHPYPNLRLAFLMRQPFQDKHNKLCPVAGN
ncbi:MAG: hypothetical protein WB284_12170 [Methanoregula sp.]